MSGTFADGTVEYPAPRRYLVGVDGKEQPGPRGLAVLLDREDVLAGEVIAVYGRGLGFADLTFDHDLLLSHTIAGIDQSVLVRSASGAGSGGVAHQLSTLARAYPGTVLGGASAEDDPVAEQRAPAWVNHVVVGLIIACTALTVVNTQAITPPRADGSSLCCG